MTTTAHVSAQTARSQVEEGKALLVCAYDDDRKCERVGLEGSISYRELEDRADALSMDQTIVFY